MSLKTRGSAAVDKAQRRLALLKSINENLDLGHGLTIEVYTRFMFNNGFFRYSPDTALTHLSNCDE
ncbi:hypothetical protein [Nostoc sp.]|uniref:hypothetical protein n=1 Tax=Nostoc sp. TaxID=1180 RepID=UPI002FFB31C7